MGQFEIMHKNFFRCLAEKSNKKFNFQPTSLFVFFDLLLVIETRSMFRPARKHFSL